MEKGWGLEKGHCFLKENTQGITELSKKTDCDMVGWRGGGEGSHQK